MTQEKQSAPPQLKNPLPVKLNSPNESEASAKGRAMIDPAVSATMVIEAQTGNTLGEDTSLTSVMDELRAVMKASHDGDLGQMEDMLIAQATALQSMFVSLVRRAQRQEYPRQLEGFMGLALRCQAQSRATIDSLVSLKYPKATVIAKQANVNQGGQQQINNNPGASNTSNTRARTTANAPNKLLEAPDGSTHLDPGTAATTARGDPAMAPLGKIHRPKNSRRQGHDRSER